MSVNAYQTDFMCTYKLLKEEDESLMLYQLQFLQAFNLNNFCDEKINLIIKILYEKYKENKYIKDLIENQKKKITSLDDLEIFKTYFGYDTFNLFHLILCNLIQNKPINVDIYNKLNVIN